MGFQKVLQWMADWGGFQGQVEFKLNRDFYPDPMSADMLMALVKGWQAGAFSDEALFEKLQRGEIIADTTTFEEESAKPRQVPEAQITSGNATQPTGGQNG
jgi:hypothetical protein